ncbi:DUF4386 family protein [Telluria aromaticivorans]|uniref:DUF4386 family protein n=1 Tax=Telluria aromaticivorans TaxID=2725995 RepID=A0A7Y2JVW3_9BURK|nr:DUF4386 family protein [Telluria aromaticivorans]NNG21653.1 DUF4386 family protein [Telluria aromaticivorans]
MNWQKIGGWAALFEAFAYLTGFAFMLTVLQPAAGAAPTAAAQLAHILGMAGLFKAWHVLIYVMFGAVLVVLVTALHEKLAAGSRPLMTVASSFGLIWAGLVIATGMIANVGLSTVARMHALDPQQATLAWQTLSAVQDGMGGGVELVGGLWVILLSLAALRQKIFSRLLNYLGVGIGAAGVMTIIPPLKDLGALFGLGQIIWFVWLGLHLLTAARRAA